MVLDEDRIGLDEASRISGKAPRTIRRWVTEGILKDLRATGDKTSPVQVSRSELRAHLATMTAPLPATANLDEPPQGQEGEGKGKRRLPSSPLPRSTSDSLTTTVDPSVVLALQGQIGAMKEQIADLRLERDRLITTVERLIAELTEARTTRASLERELVGREGIRGLLKSFWK